MEQRSAQWLADRNHAYSEWRRAIREHGKDSQEATDAHAAWQAFMAQPE